VGLIRRRWHTLSLLVLVVILARPLLPATRTDASVTKLDRTGAVSYSDDVDGGSDADWGICRGPAGRRLHHGADGLGVLSPSSGGGSYLAK